MLKLRSKILATEYKSLLENFFSLYILQLARYILPFITFPYLVRNLGVDNFGLLAFAMSFAGYFQILTDYSFNLTAVKDLSINRDKSDIVNRIFNSVFFTKLLLAFFSVIILLCFVLLIEKFRENWIVYIFSFYVIFANVFFPVWFFQGIEKMKYITTLSLIAQSISTMFIFILIQTKDDYWKVPLINGTGILFSGLISLWLINRKFNINFKFPALKEILFQLITGWNIFLSNIAINIYTVSTVFILGLLTNNTFVGYYSAADRLIQAVKGLMTPVSQSLYPFISKKFHESLSSGIFFVRRVFIYVSLFTSFISVLIFIFADKIIFLIIGEEYYESINVLKILAIHPFVISLSNILGIQTMVPLGKTRAFRNILILASVINILLSLFLVPVYKHIGSAISVTIVEFFVTFSMFIYLQKIGIKIIDFKSVITGGIK